MTKLCVEERFDYALNLVFDKTLYGSLFGFQGNYLS